MITPTTFRQWAGFSYGGSVGARAVGLLQITKASGRENQAFSIPKDSIFSARGLQFSNPESWQISESRSDPLDISVRAVSVGLAGNLAIGQQWNSPVSGILATNPAAFTLGADPQKQKVGIFPIGQDLTITDEKLQLHLDTAISICRSIIGLGQLEVFPEDDPRVKQAVFLLAMYRLENNHTQQRETSFGDSDLPLREQSYFRAKVYEPLLMQVRGLLSHLIIWKRQINGTSGEVANAQSFRLYSTKA